MEKLKDFKDELRDDLIPGVKIMKEKEAEHLKFLEDSLIKYNEMSNIGKLFLPNGFVNSLQKSIRYSTEMIAHYEQRLYEYNGYVNSN